MRLALICRPFIFHGGMETATAGLMGELLRQGYDLELLTTAGQSDIDGIRVRRLPVVRHPSIARFLSFGLAARRAVRSGRYDVVQSHERCLLQDVYRAGEGTHRAYLAAMGRRAAHVNPYHRLVLAVEKRIFRLRTSRHVVAISRQGKSEIERLYGTPSSRVTLVYNGVDLARFHPDNRERFGTATRSGIGVPRDAWLVLFVGSGFERKGLACLIEGLAGLEDRAARLVVAGTGKMEPYQALAARLGIGNRVLWAGARQDVDCLYAAADVVALPALYEPFGNVHLEALASGVPVLSSARAGGAELIRAGENGWVASEPTGAAVAQSLQAIRDGASQKLRAAARRSAEPFTYGAQVDALSAVYRHISSGPRAEGSSRGSS